MAMLTKPGQPSHLLRTITPPTPELASVLGQTLATMGDYNGAKPVLRFAWQAISRSDNTHRYLTLKLLIQKHSHGVKHGAQELKRNVTIAWHHGRTPARAGWLVRYAAAASRPQGNSWHARSRLPRLPPTSGLSRGKIYVLITISNLTVKLPLLSA